MTGINNSRLHTELEDDPLLVSGDEYIVFLNKNEDGSYRILSGPTGRLLCKNGKVNSMQIVNDRVAKANPNIKLEIVNQDFESIKNEIKKFIK